MQFSRCLFLSLLFLGLPNFAQAGLGVGGQISVTLRGVDPAEQQKINGTSHKNIVLLPGDSLQVEQKGVLDRWKGQEAAVKKLLE